MQWDTAQCHRSCLWLTDFFFRRLNLLCGANDERRTRNLHIFTQVHQRDSLPLFFCHLWKNEKVFFFISICSSLHRTTTFTQSLCDDLSPGHIIGTLRESSYLCQGRPHATCDDFFFIHILSEWRADWPEKKLITLCVLYIVRKPWNGCCDNEGKMKNVLL